MPRNFCLFVLAIYQGIVDFHGPTINLFSQVFGWRRLSALWANATEATHAHRGGVGGWGGPNSDWFAAGWGGPNGRGLCFSLSKRIPVTKGGRTKLNRRSLLSC